MCVGGGYRSSCVPTKQTLLRLPPTHHPKAPFAETSSFRAWEESKRLVSLTPRNCTMRIMRGMSIRGHYKLYIRLTAPRLLNELTRYVLHQRRNMMLPLPGMILHTTMVVIMARMQLMRLKC